MSPQQAKASSISVTTLSNGLTVITEDASTTSTVSLTYPKAGSSNETIENEQGAAFLNKQMNFKSGSGISTLLINRTIEDEGGTPFANVNRHYASVGFTVPPEKALRLVPLLATECTFEKWDVRDAREQAAKESTVAYESAQIVLTEQVFAAAYGPQSAAGRPLYGANSCSTESLQAFRARGYALNGAILSATGVPDHAAFCTEAEHVLSTAGVAAAAATTTSAPVVYLGGESRVSAPSAKYAHVALAFAGPTSSVVANVVVQFLNLAGQGASVQAFATSQGLVGVYAGSASPQTIMDVLVSTVQTAVSPAAVKRAKNLAKAQAMFAMDNGSQSLAQAMTHLVLDSNVYASSLDIAKAYDAITDQQVTGALAAMVKSNPALAAVGDIAAVPYQATVAARFK